MSYPKGILCTRDFNWANSQFPDTGSVEEEFKSIDELAEYLSNLKLYFKKSSGKICSFKGPSISEYFSTENQADDVFDTFRYLHNVVLNHYATIEIRSDCTQPLSDTFAPTAFNLGISRKIEEAAELTARFFKDNKINYTKLQVCVIPLVACAIIINIGQLFQKQFHSIFYKWLLSIIIAAIFSSALGIVLVSATRDFVTPDSNTKSTLSAMIKGDNDSETTVDMFSELSLYGKNNIDEQKQYTITDFILHSIPSNIFTALSENNVMQVLVFSCIFGIMIAFIDKWRSKPLIVVATGIYKALCKFIDYLLVLLPIAICALFSEQFSGNGISFSSIMDLLAKFIGLNYASSIIIILISFFITQISTNCSLRNHLKAIKQVFFVSIATSSAIASTPTLIENIPEPLRLDRKSVQSISPIGVLLCQTGTIAAASLLAMYSTTIYNVTFDIRTIFIILIGSIVFSFSITGLPGLAAASMLTIVLQPIGVPSELMVTIFISSVLFFQGLTVFSSLYTNIAITALVLSPKRKNKTLLVNSSQ